MHKPDRIRSLYIDFDAFFANIEKQIDPAIRDSPVGVTALDSDFSALITCCYMAKGEGIRRGMRVREAREICPGLVIRVARPDVYVDIHNRIVAEVNHHVPVRKVWSIDEVECALIGHECKESERLAREIRAGLAAHIGPHITPSIGLGPNQFLAKVAAEMQKPAGLVTLHPDALPGPLLALDLDDLPGISSSMKHRLNAAGVLDMRGLWGTSPKQARAIWGNVEGERLWAQLHGYAVSRPETKRRMFGHSRVLSGAFRHPDKAIDCLQLLTIKAAYRLRREDYHAGALSISLRLADRQRWSGEKRFAHCRDDLTFIRHMKALFRQGLHETGRPTKLKGVHVMLHNIARADEITRTLFDANTVNPCEAEWDTLMGVMDGLNERHGKAVLRVGGNVTVPGGYAGAKIAFGRVPEKEDFY